jgi:hypothetical protein
MRRPLTGFVGRHIHLGGTRTEWQRKARSRLGKPIWEPVAIRVLGNLLFGRPRRPERKKGSRERSSRLTP